jgi:flagellar biogenesis protein FliO
MLILKAMPALAVVVFCAYLVLGKWLKKIYGGDLGLARISVKERHALAPKCALLIIEVDGREILIGSSENGVNFLMDLSEERDAKVFHHHPANVFGVHNGVGRHSAYKHQ